MHFQISSQPGSFSSPPWLEGPRSQTAQGVGAAARLTLRDNVKVSLRALAALRNPRLPPLDLGQSAGWARLMEVETVRDRITHPKTANDLIVSTPECIAFNEAVLWYFRILLDCLALPRPSFLGTAPPLNSSVPAGVRLRILIFHNPAPTPASRKLSATTSSTA